MGNEAGLAGRHGSLREIGRAAARVAAALARLAGTESRGPGGSGAAAARTAAAGETPAIDARFVRGLIEADRLRAVWFGTACADPAWAVLTALYLARLEGRPVRLSALAAEAGLPATTAARRVEALAAAGLVVRRPSAHPRGVRLALADEAAAAMQAYFTAAMKL